MTSFQYLMSTTIPPGKNRFLSDHRSQVRLGEISTWMVDCLGILRVVDFSIFLCYLKSVYKKLNIIDFWVKNDQLPISYVYDHTTRKKPVLV